MRTIVFLPDNPAMNEMEESVSFGLARKVTSEAERWA